ALSWRIHPSKASRSAECEREAKARYYKRLPGRLIDFTVRGRTKWRVPSQAATRPGRKLWSAGVPGQRQLDETKLTRTIASTATIKLVNLPNAELVHTPLEERFERLTRLARRTLNVPVAGVMLRNGDKQWFKSIAGWNVAELPAHLTLCDWTLEERKLHVVPDMAVDPRTAKHPYVTGSPMLRFYAGFPLYDRNAAPTGSFCVFDTQP